MNPWLIALIVVLVVIIIVVPVSIMLTSNNGSDDSGDDACFIVVQRPEKNHDAVKVRLDDGTYSKKYSDAMNSQCLKTYSDGTLPDKENADLAIDENFTDGVDVQSTALYYNDSDIMVTSDRWSFDDGTGVNIV